MQIPVSNTGILFVVIALLVICPIECGDMKDNIIDKSPQISYQHLQQAVDNTSPLPQVIDTLFEDEFNTIPLGFNTSLWNLSTHSNPPIGWEDGEWLVLRAEPLSYLILESSINTGTNVISEFNLTFTEGFSYFGVGWGDGILDPNSEWRANLRQSQNGIFIDYWDNELCLATYCGGKRVVAPVQKTDLKKEHLFRIEWQPTLVRLFIDNELNAQISRRIPQKSLPFIIATSGHYEFSKNDELRIEFLRISSIKNPNVNNPIINLIWPLNGSQMTSHDYVDLEITGSKDLIFYSWNGHTNETAVAPWDIKVPQDEGDYVLSVFAQDDSDAWNSETFSFKIVLQELFCIGPKMQMNPLVDGNIEFGEKQQSIKRSYVCMNENRYFEDIIMYLSFPAESIYVGVETELADKWNSRLSLLIDGDGDGVWDVDELNFPEDVRFTIGTPSSYGAFSKVFSPLGYEISNSLFPGSIAASSSDGGRSSFEFMFNLTSVQGNASRGIGIGLVISRGGYNSFFPAQLGYGISSDLVIVYCSGEYNPDPMDLFLVIGGSTFFSLVGLFGLIYVISTRRAVSLDTTFDDEDLERVKTILHSYDKISLDRLSRLVGLNPSRVRDLVEKLVKRGLTDITLIEFEEGFIRSLPESERRDNNPRIGGDFR